MKYLNSLRDDLLRMDRNEPEIVRTALVELLEAHDRHLQLAVREEYGELVRRDRLAEVIAASSREGIEAVVQAALDARQVPPGLRESLEAIFIEALESAIRRASRIPS